MDNSYLVQNIGPNFDSSLRPASQIRNLPSAPTFNEPGQDYNTQLILAKLDLINSRIQNIEQKVALIEQIAKQSQEPEQKWSQRRIY